MYSCDIFTNFGGHFVFEFLVGKRQNRAWHRADLESAYPNCVGTTACQILLKNALTNFKNGPRLYSILSITVKKICVHFYYLGVGLWLGTDALFRR